MLDLDAGKYAVYVWSAFAISAAVFVILIVSALAYSRRWRRRADARERS